jgi:Zn-dependent M28 family amino/carboxypeptidase
MHPTLALSCLLAAAPLLAVPLTAQQGSPPGARVAAALSGDVLRGHLEFLADDALEGRAPGTRGGDLAQKYLASQFRRLGLEPAGDSGSYYQRVPIIALTPTPTLAIAAPSPRQLKWKDDYVLWSARNDSSVQVRGDAVFVGYGIVAPEAGWNDYAGLDARGKIVVALVNDPGLQDSTLFRGKILTYYGRWTYKIEEARRQGAAGLLLIHTDESATYPWSTVLSGWTGAQVRLESPPDSLIVAGWLQKRTAEDLFIAGGQDLAALTATAARKGFRPVPLGLELEGRVRSTIRRTETANVLARLPGRGPLAKEAVLIGGHYDGYGIATPQNGDSIYNGAEDNASGTAAVLAAAEAFVRSGVRTSRSLIFVGFAAEESGLIGSQALANDPPVPLADLAAILNLDVMNLYGPTTDVSALGLDQSTLGKAFTAAASAEGLKVSSNEEALLRGSYFRSDHFPLARVGVPGTSVENGSSYLGKPTDYGKEQKDKYIADRYHQASDEILPWFTYDGAIQQLRVTVRTAVSIANAPSQPDWAGGSEFRAAGLARRKPTGS